MSCDKACPAGIATAPQASAARANGASTHRRNALIEPSCIGAHQLELGTNTRCCALFLNLRFGSGTRGESYLIRWEPYNELQPAPGAVRSAGAFLQQHLSPRTHRGIAQHAHKDMKDKVGGTTMFSMFERPCSGKGTSRSRKSPTVSICRRARSTATCRRPGRS